MTTIFGHAIALILIVSTVSSGNSAELQLQTEGTARYLGVLKVYDAALYVPLQVTADQIMDAEISRCLKLTYHVGLTAKDFRSGADTILSRQNSAEKLARISAEIDQLHNAYKDVEKGDSYSLCFDADTQTTTLSLNQEQLTAVHSAEFAQIYFGIWLGPVAPIDESLREQLLGPFKTN